MRSTPGHRLAGGTNKKGDLKQVAFQYYYGSGRSGAAGAFGTATGATGAEVYPAVQFETVLMEIDLDGLGFFKKFRVDDELKTVDVKRLVRVGKLIQSHGQSWASSAAFVEENPDRFDILSFEILGNLLNCRLCDLKHDTLLVNKKNRPESRMDRKPSIGFRDGT